MVSLVDGGRPSALKIAAGKWVDPRAASGEKALKEAFGKGGWDWATVPIDFPLYWGYGGLDTILTARMAEALYPIIEARYKSLYEIERGSGRVLYNMEEKGARIDPEYITTTRDRLQREVDALTSWGKVQHDGLSIGSPQQLVGRLQYMGAVLEKTTKSGAYSSDSVVLTLLGLSENEELASLARNALRCRKARKTISAYLDNFLNLCGSDDRLHPSIRQLGAKTGRMSVATPSLQNLTRGPEVRDCFIPSDGNLLVLADYDQIEARLLYHYCRDPALYQAIMSDDLHSTVARLIYSDSTIQKDDPRRQIAKSSGYAKIYGAGIEQFAATAGVLVSEARDFLRLYDETFPGVPNWIGHVQAVGRNRLKDEGEAWVKTAGGRRQVAYPDKLYTLTNYLIQGTAADVLKEQVIQLDAAGLGAYMILPVHDEIVFDVPEADVADVLHTIDEVMPVPAEKFGVPLTVGTGVYDRWGGKYRKQGIMVDDALELKDITEEDE
jgi:DNA polymerase-1